MKGSKDKARMNEDILSENKEILERIQEKMTKMSYEEQVPFEDNKPLGSIDDEEQYVWIYSAFFPKNVRAKGVGGKSTEAMFSEVVLSVMTDWNSGLHFAKTEHANIAKYKFSDDDDDEDE